MRRVLFFLIAAGIALALAPAAPPALRYVPEWLSATYAALALAFGAEAFSQRRD